MVNTLLLSHKALGSAALRCGASSFGVKSCGKFSKYPSQFVAVFKTREKRNRFINFLLSQNLNYEADYYYKHVLHNNQFLHIVFVKLFLFIPSAKLGFNNFRQLCNTKQIEHYSNSCYSHPHSQLKNNTNIN